MKRNNSEIVKKGHHTKKINGVPGPFTSKTHTDEHNKQSSNRQIDDRVNKRAHMLEKMSTANIKLLNDIRDNKFDLVCEKCEHHFSLDPQNFNESRWIKRKVQCQICKSIK